MRPGPGLAWPQRPIWPMSAGKGRSPSIGKRTASIINTGPAPTRREISRSKTSGLALTSLLNAFTDGVLGNYCRADVKVEPGKTTTLGELHWTPVRYGKQIWEIGVPDRSAGEFRHGDNYWQWGLYNLYPQEFPRGVDFVIGKSDWKRDWNYAQPPISNGHGGWTNSTWRIRFNLDHPSEGTATLRLTICGARGGPVDVAVNGTSIGGTGELPESGVMHRDGIRSDSLTECNLKFDAALLKSGENTITLTKHARAWTDGVLYDYLRLELDSQKSFTR